MTGERFLCAVLLAVSVANPALAQTDPCDVCQAEHGVAACPCLPVAAEPTPLPVPPPPPGSTIPPGGTIPPVTGIACITDQPQPDISGCDDKMFMPLVGR